MSAVIVTSPQPAPTGESEQPPASETTTALVEIAHDQGAQEQTQIQQQEQIENLETQQQGQQSQNQYLENRLAQLETGQTEIRSMIENLIEAWEAEDETEAIGAEIEVVETLPEAGSDNPAPARPQRSRLHKAIFGTPRY